MSKLVPIYKQQEKVNGKKEQDFYNYCPVHESEKVKFYCFNCNAVHCSLCGNSTHRNHLVRTIPDAIEQLSQNLPEIQEEKLNKLLESLKQETSETFEIAKESKILAITKLLEKKSLEENDLIIKLYQIICLKLD
ncbi:meiotic p26 isoform c [Anaeramoeba flamelloides]|uniref:Meiotic p26 isoform c n=1 Tax=Anaeramoeba flamelloides TaxID=1746091 RepID=A0AAV7Y430_9EUKA|nr:meiotic p26 isoform c [Anaeramoeba flamelloides]